MFVAFMVGMVSQVYVYGLRIHQFIHTKYVSHILKWFKEWEISIVSLDCVLLKENTEG